MGFEVSPAFYDFEVEIASLTLFLHVFGGNRLQFCHLAEKLFKPTVNSYKGSLCDVVALPSDLEEKWSNIIYKG